MYKIFLLSLYTLLHNIPAYSFECSNTTDQEFIKEAILIDFSGARIDGHQNSKCLNQKHFKYVQVVFDASNEEASKEHYLIDDIKSLKIDAPISKDKQVSVYSVNFEYKAQSIKDKKEHQIQDKIVYMKNTSKEASDAIGCISVLESPKKLTLLKKCLIKKK